MTCPQCAEKDKLIERAREALESWTPAHSVESMKFLVLSILSSAPVESGKPSEER